MRPSTHDLKHTDVRDPGCLADHAEADPEFCGVADRIFSLGPGGVEFLRGSLDPSESKALSCPQEVVAGRAVAVMNGGDHRVPFASGHAVRILTKGEDVKVAALYVQNGGIYYNRERVDPWDEQRDARLYDGPWPVVAHPPCKAWSLMSQCRPEIVRGEDGGCFNAALAAVRKFGGVLEHPAYSQAWRAFQLARPAAEGWTQSFGDPGWTCQVDQAQYGHPANKQTWLYYVGPTPPQLLWGRAPNTGRTVRSDGGGGRDQRSITPRAFALELIRLARLSLVEAAA